jgi:hypothetical protein
MTAQSFVSATARDASDIHELSPDRAGPGLFIPPPPLAPRELVTPKRTRVLSILALTTLACFVFALAHAGYLALTDAWVAPLQLSPESRDVVTVRMQAAKEREERARLEGELTSSVAEIAAIDSSIERLRTLETNYSNAIQWSQTDRADQLAALARQKAILEDQRAMLAGSIARDKAAVERAERNVGAGMITAVDLDTARSNLARTQVEMSDKTLEHARVLTALAVASREEAALAGAATTPGTSGTRGAAVASPDVVRFDEVRINIELRITQLDAEKRAAEARQRAAQASIQSMDELRGELESTPAVLAAQGEIDLAFVPYAHLNGLRAGDAVYTCRWFLFGCHVAGRIRQIFPGEVVNDDPWGSIARGRYVQLEMSDRSAMRERTLRVRVRPPFSSELIQVSRPSPRSPS